MLNKKRKTQFYFGLVMASTMFFVSCNKTSVVKTAQDEQSSQIMQRNSVLTGIDWFKSIFYADGPLTSQIPSISDYSPIELGLDGASLDHYRQTQDDVIGRISATNPSFFADYEAAMESGDPVRISKMIEDSKEIVYDATKEVMSGQGYDLDQEMLSYYEQMDQSEVQAKGIVLLIVVIIVIAVAINLTHTSTKVSCGTDPLSCSHIRYQGNPQSIESTLMAAEIANIP